MNRNFFPAFFRRLIGRSSRLSRDVVVASAQDCLFKLRPLARPVSDCERVELRKKLTFCSKVVVQAAFDAQFVSQIWIERGLRFCLTVEFQEPEAIDLDASEAE